MGRKVVVEIECDRCTRVEHRSTDTGTQDGPMFSGTFHGRRVEYNDLCTACEEIVTLRWAEIAKSLKKASPQRDRSSKKGKDGVLEPKLKPLGASPRS